MEALYLRSGFGCFGGAFDPGDLFRLEEKSGGQSESADCPYGVTDRGVKKQEQTENGLLLFCHPCVQGSGGSELAVVEFRVEAACFSRVS